MFNKKDFDKIHENRKKVEEFFGPKRKALFATKEDPPQVKMWKQRFLSELNSLAMDIEHEALNNPDKALQRAEKEFSKMKKRFIGELKAFGPGEALKSFGLPEDLIKGKNSDLIKLIESL